MNKRRSYDIDSTNIQTLAQKLVSKNEYSYMKDFAMNTKAHLLPFIDHLVKVYEKLGMIKLAEYWKEYRILILKSGEAEFVENADILTNLGLKLGLTGEKQISGKPTSQTLQ